MSALRWAVIAIWTVVLLGAVAMFVVDLSGARGVPRWTASIWPVLAVLSLRELIEWVFEL